MSIIVYREASVEGIPCIAKNRSVNSGHEVYWANRTETCLNSTVGPQKALKKWIAFVATDEEKIVGFAAAVRMRWRVTMDWHLCKLSLSSIGVTPAFLLH